MPNIAQSSVRNADWTVILDAFTVSNSEWKEYKVQMPQQYKHFALQCCSQSGYALLLDDISYDIPQKTLTGYRVYRDGVLVSLLTANTTTYIDPSPGTDSYYYVTAMYDDGGESAHSNIYGKAPEPVLEPEPEPEPEPSPADVNFDGVVDVSDIATIIDFIASGWYDATVDVNRDGVIDVADIATIIDVIAGN